MRFGEALRDDDKLKVREGAHLWTAQVADAQEVVDRVPDPPDNHVPG